MKDMSIKEFCDKYNACSPGREWGKRRCKSGMMSEAYDKLSRSKSLLARPFWNWTWSRSFNDLTLIEISIRLIKETPLKDGRFVYDLLTDSRSINMINMAEKYIKGGASKKECRSVKAANVANAANAANSADATADAAAAYYAYTAAAYAYADVADDAAAAYAYAAAAYAYTAYTAYANAAAAYFADAAYAAAAYYTAAIAADADANAAAIAANAADAATAKMIALDFQKKIILEYGNPFKE